MGYVIQTKTYVAGSVSSSESIHFELFEDFMCYVENCRKSEICEAPTKHVIKRKVEGNFIDE